MLIVLRVGLLLDGPILGRVIVRLTVMCLHLLPSGVLLLGLLDDDGLGRQIQLARGHAIEEFDGLSSILADLRSVFLEEVQALES